MTYLSHEEAEAGGFATQGEWHGTGKKSSLPRNPAILIVDDDIDDRHLIERTLKRVDSGTRKVLHADSFEAAIEQLRSHCFDVALVDLRLGADSGLELFERVGGRDCETPIVMVTGADDRATDLAAMSAGVLNYLKKQELSPELLERTIRYACHTHALEHQLRNTLQDVRQANEAKSDFLARMSHDFRTPLNAILGFSEIIRDEMFGPISSRVYCDYAGDIYNSGSHLLELVSDLLDLAKIEAGKIGLLIDLNDVDKLITAAVSLAQGMADERGVRLRRRTNPNLPRLLVDPRALTQMLLNLISNAVKFGDPGGAVDISADVSGDEFTITVSDDGAGMTNADIELFLQPFGRRDNMVSSRHDGSGLGLSIVKSLIEMHGGRLEIDSDVGLGTRVRLVLPHASVNPKRH